MKHGDRIGEVTNYFNRISVAVIQLQQQLNIGDTVHFLGRHTDFKQQVLSMQIEHQPVEMGEAGGEVAVKVKERVRRGDSIFRITEEE